MLVTGANGFIGARVVTELIARGYPVRVFVRAGSDTSRIDSFRVERALGDVRDLSALSTASVGCEAIVHLAGPSSWKKIRDEADELESVIVTGTRNVLRAAHRAKVRRTVVVSSSAAIGATLTPKIQNEESRYRIGHRALAYSLAKRGAERAVREAIRRTGIDALIVNPCETYGPDDRELVTAGNLVAFLGRAPAGVCEGGTSVAHVEDVARGIVLALERGRSGERYILGGENLSLTEIARTVRRIAGRSDRVVTLPSAAIGTVSRACERVGVRPPVASDVLAYASLYWFVDSSKAERELGYRSRSAKAVFREVVPALLLRDRARDRQIVPSLRYGGGSFDARSGILRLLGAIQGKPVVFLDSDPRLCGEVLAASDRKGTFIEQLIATPAWDPVYSMESMDGERWEQLARDFKTVLARTEWRERLLPLVRKHLVRLRKGSGMVSSETIARLTVRTLAELLFRVELSDADEILFYQASLEWRREIAVKSPGNRAVKRAFWERLRALVDASEFRRGMDSYAADPAAWLSLFAQPFLLSPQINVGDIFVSVFSFLRADPALAARARTWAAGGDRARLDGIVLEAIRLKHPFPILERELRKDFRGRGGTAFSAGTQVFILLDRFRQDPGFDPERWLRPAAENPYAAIPFAAGPRMCIGKPIAMELLAELLRSFLVEFPMERVRPEVGHLYSGRSNDGATSFGETAYQLRVFGRGIWESLRLRRASGVRSGKSSGCPYPHGGVGTNA